MKEPRIRNKHKKISLFIDSTIAFLICISPFFLYLYNVIPEGVENYDTWFGTIKGGQFERAQVFVYLIINKFVPLFLFILLYITNKNWWSQVILIPIATYIFQLASIIVDSTSTFDEIEFIYVIPIMVIIITPLYYFRKKLDIYLNALDLKKEMEEVIKNPKR